MNGIRYLRHAEIDKDKWDNCIAKADNGLIYAKSVYLDAMCEKWNALIYDDYEAVMPLPLKGFAGLSYVYQPFFTQQGGIFGADASESDLIAVFLKAATEKFRKIDLHLNFANKGFGIARTNFVLDLNTPFEELKKGFRKDLVTKALKARLLYEKSNDFMAVISLYQRLYQYKTPEIKAKDYRRFATLCERLARLNMLETRAVMSADGTLLSAAIFLKDERRIYYIMSVLKPQGRQVDATAFLLYSVIKEYAGQPLIFDFEGSEIPSVKSFFKKFSPRYEPYYVIRKGWLSGPSDPKLR